MILYKLPAPFIVLTIAIIAGLTSYAEAAIVDIDKSSPHSPSPSDHFATINGKKSWWLALKGTETETKFLKPKRNIRSVRKTKGHTRRLQASQLDIVVGNADKSGLINQLLVNNGAGGYDEADVDNLPGGASVLMLTRMGLMISLLQILAVLARPINCSLTMAIIHSLLQIYQEELWIRQVLPLPM